jgi:predicted lipoprotein with Yx(FWY)xxD motif
VTSLFPFRELDRSNPPRMSGFPAFIRLAGGCCLGHIAAAGRKFMYFHSDKTLLPEDARSGYTRGVVNPGPGTVVPTGEVVGVRRPGRSWSMVAALLLLVAACAPAAAPPEATVKVRDVPGFGLVLVDMDDSTLYVSDEEWGGTARCTGACTRIWPPLTVLRGSTPRAGAGVPGVLATIDRSDGLVQVTYDGRPLYLYSLDTGPDVIKGNGVTEESLTPPLTWRAATPDGRRRVT